MINEIFGENGNTVVILLAGTARFEFDSGRVGKAASGLDARELTCLIAGCDHKAPKGWICWKHFNDDAFGRLAVTAATTAVGAMRAMKTWQKALAKQEEQAEKETFTCPTCGFERRMGLLSADGSTCLPCYNTPEAIKARIAATDKKASKVAQIVVESRRQLGELLEGLLKDIPQGNLHDKAKELVDQAYQIATEAQVIAPEGDEPSMKAAWAIEAELRAMLDQAAGQAAINWQKNSQTAKEALAKSRQRLLVLLGKLKINDTVSQLVADAKAAKKWDRLQQIWAEARDEDDWQNQTRLKAEHQTAMAESRRTLFGILGKLNQDIDNMARLAGEDLGLRNQVNVARERIAEVRFQADLAVTREEIVQAWSQLDGLKAVIKRLRAALHSAKSGSRQAKKAVTTPDLGAALKRTLTDRQPA